MADSRDSAPAGPESGRRDCAYCPMSGADVCVGVIPTTSGAGHTVYAHQACADARGLRAIDEQTGRAS